MSARLIAGLVAAILIALVPLAASDYLLHIAVQILLWGFVYTAWAIMGICACGDLDRPSVQRGLRFLLGSQKPDGSWDEEQITGTGFPRVFYLKYDMYRQHFPLLALATYVNYRSGLGHCPSFYCCDR